MIAHAAQPAAAPGLDADAPPTPHVLIADDEPTIRFAVRACLEAEGHHVIEAEDGAACLERVHQDHPNVLLLDLSMPGMTGHDVLAALADAAAHGEPTPAVVVLTAHGSPAVQRQAFRAGVYAVLDKPVLPVVLRVVVRNAYESWLVRHSPA